MEEKSRLLQKATKILKWQQKVILLPIITGIRVNKLKQPKRILFFIFMMNKEKKIVGKAVKEKPNLSKWR